MKRGMMRTFFAGMLIFQVSCHQSGNTRINNLAPNVHQVIAKEVLQATNYTYIQVKEEDNQYWVAITKSDIKTGGTYYWSQGMPMENFPSKDLDRTFPLLYLVQNFTDKPITQDGQSSSSSSWAGNQPATKQQDISVTPAGNGISLEELYTHKDQYAGKKVIVRGKVVKYNPHIMDKNWIHIQDGTNSGNDFDLALTTQDEVKIGDIVTFEGVITLDKDYGAGYFYKVIMEDAKRIDGQQ